MNNNAKYHEFQEVFAIMWDCNTAVLLEYFISKLEYHKKHNINYFNGTFWVKVEKEEVLKDLPFLSNEYFLKYMRIFYDRDILVKDYFSEGRQNKIVWITFHKRFIAKYIPHFLD